MATSSLFNEELLKFCGEHTRDRLSMEILAFWGRHPEGRFMVGTVARAMDAKRLDVMRVIRLLSAEGIIDTFIQDDVVTYRLADNERIRRQAMELAALNWYGRRAMCEHLGWKY